MKNRSGRSWLIALFAAVALLATACSSSSSSKSTTTTTAAKATTSTAAADTAGLAKLTGTLAGAGSSLQDTFQQQVSSDFNKAVQSAGGSATVSYTKSSSTDGKKALAEDPRTNFAGSDSLLKPEEVTAFGTRKILYFPIIGSPISVAYKLKGVTTLKLDADVIAGIFQAKITSWNDPKIAALNSGVTLPATKITVVHRSDGSGTTKNFTTYLTAASPTVWTLGAGETVNWPASTQGAEKSTGVTSVIKSTDGAIGYADLADAAKESLDVASVKNANGDFVAPTPDGASAALAAATVAPDLTFNPMNAKGKGAYPITSPTFMLVDQKQPNAAQAALVKAYLNYVLTTGQGQAKGLLYAPLPSDLAAKAVTQIDSITAG